MERGVSSVQNVQRIDLCPWCSEPPIEVKGKAICPACKCVVQTCCEGGPQ